MLRARRPVLYLLPIAFPDVHDTTIAASAHRMKHTSAAGLAAADACPLTEAKITAHLPSFLRHFIDADDGAHSFIVLNTGLGDPYGTHDVSPATVIRCLERSFFLVAQTAHRGRGLRIAFLALRARVTEPRTSGNFLDAVANLMHGHVTSVANDDQIVVI